jgi:hypothetical protein
MILYFSILLHCIVQRVLQADKHTRKETTKVTTENSTGKTKMETCRVWPREKKAKKQRSRILQTYENKNTLHT